MPFAEYPFRSHWFDLAGLRMHYLDEGRADAPPVVMLHGNPTWSYYYRHLIVALADRFRCIVPDHIGMGLSDKPADAAYEYTLVRRVTDIEALLEHLGIRNHAALVVHDWGGMIGMAVAVRRPERFERFVVFNTSAFGMLPGKRLPWQLALARRPILGPLAVQGLNAFARGAMRRCVVRRRLPRDVRRAYLAPYDSWSHRRGVLRFVQDIPLSPADASYQLATHVAARLHTLADRPMLLAWGLADFVFDEDFLSEWRQRFLDADVYALNDAGHLVLEDAREEVILRVREFLTSGKAGQ